MPSRTEPAPGGRGSGASAGALLAIAGAAFLAYANALGNAFVLDDRLAIVQNRKVTGFEAGRILREPGWFALAGDTGWRPLTTLSFAVDWSWHGPSASWPRAENLALHAGASSLVYLLALEIGLAPAGALIAGLLFAAHPVHTEVLNPIVGRGDLLATAFSLAALIGFLRGHAAAALASFALGLFAKESTIALLFFLPFLAGWPPSKPEARRRWAILIGLGLVFAAYMALRRAVTGHWMPGGTDTAFLDNPLIGLDAPRRVANAAYVLWRYALLLFVPWPLSSDYSYDAIAVLPAFSARNLTAGAALLAAAAGLRRWSRLDPRIGFAAGLLASSLFLVSNLPFAIGTIMGERLLFLPSAGFCLAAGAWLEGRRRRWLLAAALPAWLALCWARNRDWKDDDAVFLAALRSAPGSVKAMTNGGQALLNRGRPEEARAVLLRAIEKDGRYSLTFSTLGLAYRKLGEPDRAEEAFLRSVELDPGFVDGWVNLGIVYGETGRLERSLEALDRALSLDPLDAKLHNNLGVTCKRKAVADLAAGRAGEAGALLQRAASHYRRALELEPGYAQAVRNLQALDDLAREAGGALTPGEGAATMGN